MFPNWSQNRMHGLLQRISELQIWMRRPYKSDDAAVPQVRPRKINLFLLSHYHPPQGLDLEEGRLPCLPLEGASSYFLCLGYTGSLTWTTLKLLLFFRSKLQGLFGPVGIQLAKQKLQKPYTGQFKSTNLKIYFWDIRHCDGSFLPSKE